MRISFNASWYEENQANQRSPLSARRTIPSKVLSGVFEGRSTGTPISILIRNKDAKSKDYSHIAEKYRPSHADYTYQEKYGVRDYRGGGRSSARETAARVAAGAVAKLFLKSLNIEITAYVSQVGNIKNRSLSPARTFQNRG